MAVTVIAPCMIYVTNKFNLNLIISNINNIYQRKKTLLIPSVPAIIPRLSFTCTPVWVRLGGSAAP